MGRGVGDGVGEGCERGLEGGGRGGWESYIDMSTTDEKLSIRTLTSVGDCLCLP